MAELLDDLWTILDKTERWDLDARGWAYVDTLLGRVIAALDSGSAEDLRVAVSDLEVSGPDRTQDADSGKPGNRPARTRDRVQETRERIDPRRAETTKGERTGDAGR